MKESATKDVDKVTLASGIFCTVLPLVLAMFPELHIFIKFILFLSLLIAGFFFAWSLISYFKPLKDLPLAIKRRGIIMEGNVTPFVCAITNNLEQSVRVGVEYRHLHSMDGRSYSEHESYFGEISISSAQTQSARLIECERLLVNHVRFESGVGFLLQKIKLNYANSEITKSSKVHKPYQILIIIFSLNGYRPVKKTIWLDSKGHIFSTRPEDWPDENAN